MVAEQGHEFLLLFRRQATRVLPEHEARDLRDIEVGVEQLAEAGDPLRFGPRERLEALGAEILDKGGGPLTLRRSAPGNRRAEQDAQEQCADGKG